MSDTFEPGQLLLQLLQLLGWEIAVSRGERVHVTASRPVDGLQVEATGRTLADASFFAYERASRMLVERRTTPIPAAA